LQAVANIALDGALPLAQNGYKSLTKTLSAPRHSSGHG